MNSSVRKDNRISCEICKRINIDILWLPCCHSCCTECYILWTSGAKLEYNSAYYTNIKLSGDKLGFKLLT